MSKTVWNNVIIPEFNESETNSFFFHFLILHFFSIGRKFSLFGRVDKNKNAGWIPWVQWWLKSNWLSKWLHIVFLSLKVDCRFSWLSPTAGYLVYAPFLTPTLSQTYTCLSREFFYFHGFCRKSAIRFDTKVTFENIKRAVSNVIA